MSIFISGSVAYDTILSFKGVFADHLLEGSLEKINLTFQTPVMSKNFGGCAANIAYGLKPQGANRSLSQQSEKTRQNTSIILKSLVFVPMPSK